MSTDAQTTTLELYARVIPALPNSVVIQAINLQLDFQSPDSQDELTSQVHGTIGVDIIGSYAKAFLSTQGPNPDLESLRNSMHRFMECLLNNINYKYCRLHTINTDYVVVNRGMGTQDVQNMSALPAWTDLEHATQDAREVSIDDLIQVQMSDVQLQLALSDLRDALANHFNTAFYAYRAIESIKDVFTEGDRTRSENNRRGWETMRSRLRVSEAFITEIKHEADRQRHGRVSQVLAGERLEAMRRAWLVVGRYVQYALGGNEGLSEDIPLLE